MAPSLSSLVLLSSCLVIQALKAYISFTVDNYVLVDHQYKTISNIKFSKCVKACKSERSCISVNFEGCLSSEGCCVLNGCGVEDEKDKGESFVFSPGCLFHQVRSTEAAIRKGGKYTNKCPVKKTTGVHKTQAAVSCRALSQHGRVSGTYWLDLDGGSHDNAFQAFCDMDTDGGGWTLVWSYTFTSYLSFQAGTNAITPRPNWTTQEADVPVSTQVPLTDEDYGALDFQQWKKIGEEFLMKSNINNWVACVPKSGNLVQWVSGEVNCRLVKQVATICNDTLPHTFKTTMRYGPSLIANSFYTYYDGSTSRNWPVHDPCGQNRGNQVKNVADPHGSIYIR